MPRASSLTDKDKARILELMSSFQRKDGKTSWKQLQEEHFPDHCPAQIRKAATDLLQKQLAEGAVKHVWNEEEDNDRLIELVQKYPSDKVEWKAIAAHFPGWTNKALISKFRIIDPSKKTGPFDQAEVCAILKFVLELNDINDVSKVAASALNREQKFVKKLMTKCVIPSLEENCEVGSDRKFDIGEGEHFERVVGAVWKDVVAFNSRLRGKKHPNKMRDKSNNVTTSPLTDAKIAAAANRQNNHSNATKRQATKNSEREKTLLQKALITEEEKEELANPNTEQEWAQKAQAAEKMILSRGFPQMMLDGLNDCIKSELQKNPILFVGGRGIKSGEAKRVRYSYGYKN